MSNLQAEAGVKPASREGCEITNAPGRAVPSLYGVAQYGGVGPVLPRPDQANFVLFLRKKKQLFRIL